jgi:hypothetical protein
MPGAFFHDMCTSTMLCNLENLQHALLYSRIQSDNPHGIALLPLITQVYEGFFISRVNRKHVKKPVALPITQPLPPTPTLYQVVLIL